MPKGRGCKAKGDGYERELASWFNQHLFGGQERAFRAPLSGGGFVGIGRGGMDVGGLPGLFPEAKRVEKVNVLEALKQAESNKAASRSPEIPVVFTRRNHTPTEDSTVVLRLKDFATFYRAWLVLGGYIKSDSNTVEHLDGEGIGHG
jgi:hypothetical protein